MISTNDDSCTIYLFSGWAGKEDAKSDIKMKYFDILHTCVGPLYVDSFRFYLVLFDFNRQLLPVRITGNKICGKQLPYVYGTVTLHN